MPRTRVHNMNISLDGYAAGEHVTFDAPIGGAERLFKWFDGRVIHGVDKADAPITLDRALEREHRGEGEYRGEVANLSRNVVIESADPARGRGHTMYHRGSSGSIGHAEFRLDLIHERMRESCYLNPGLTISVVDARTEPAGAYTFYFEGGILSYVRHLNANKTALHQPIAVSRAIASTLGTKTAAT